MDRAGPSPDASPEDVVTAVLRSLAGAAPGPVDGTSVAPGPVDAGSVDDAPVEDAAAAVHAFASDRLRSTLGGEDGLRRALGNTLYRHLLRHRHAVVESLVRHGDAARAVVSVTAADGTDARFTFALARAVHGDRRGCWLLSGLAREGVDL